MNVRIGVFFAFTALAVPACFSQQIHPRMTSKEFVPAKVVVLPAQVHLTKQGVKGSEGMGKEEEESATTLAEGCQTALKGMGLQLEDPFTVQKLAANTELRAALADVQRKFDQVAPQLYKKPKDVKKGRFTVGDIVGNINQTQADTMVVLRSEGVKQTKGKAFLGGGLMGMAMSGQATFVNRFVLLDGKNGEVMYFHTTVTRGVPSAKDLSGVFKKVKTGGK